MRVAQHARPHQLGVRVDLACRVQAAAGVVEVDLAAFVEAGVFDTPQLREDAVRVEFGIPAGEIRFCLAEPRRLVGRSIA